MSYPQYMAEDTHQVRAEDETGSVSVTYTQMGQFDSYYHCMRERLIIEYACGHQTVMPVIFNLTNASRDRVDEVLTSQIREVMKSPNCRSCPMAPSIA